MMMRSIKIKEGMLNLFTILLMSSKYPPYSPCGRGGRVVVPPRLVYPMHLYTECVMKSMLKDCSLLLPL